MNLSLHLVIILILFFPSSNTLFVFKTRFFFIKKGKQTTMRSTLFFDSICCNNSVGVRINGQNSVFVLICNVNVLAYFLKERIIRFLNNLKN
jgi:hypothetical protein